MDLNARRAKHMINVTHLQEHASGLKKNKLRRYLVIHKCMHLHYRILPVACPLTIPYLKELRSLNCGTCQSKDLRTLDFSDLDEEGMPL